MAVLQGLIKFLKQNLTVLWPRFVKAETYLTKHLHYPKIKVYFLLLVLYKKVFFSILTHKLVFFKLSFSRLFRDYVELDPV